MSRRTHCRYGHELNERTSFFSMKKRRGRWYKVMSCRVCHSIETSVYWYSGKKNTRGYRYSGAPLTLDEITRRTERRWAKRFECPSN